MYTLHKEVTLFGYVQLCKHVSNEEDTKKLPKGHKSEGIRLTGRRNLKIHLCPILKLRNRDSDNQKRFNKEDQRSDGADVQEGQATQRFDIDGKLYLPSRLAQTSRFIIQTGPGTIEFSELISSSF